MPDNGDFYYGGNRGKHTVGLGDYPPGGEGQKWYTTQELKELQRKRKAQEETTNPEQLVRELAGPPPDRAPPGDDTSRDRMAARAPGRNEAGPGSPEREYTGVEREMAAQAAAERLFRGSDEEFFTFLNSIPDAALRDYLFEHLQNLASRQFERTSDQFAPTSGAGAGAGPERPTR